MIQSGGILDTKEGAFSLNISESKTDKVNPGEEKNLLSSRRSSGYCISEENPALREPTEIQTDDYSTERPNTNGLYDNPSDDSSLCKRPSTKQRVSTNRSNFKKCLCLTGSLLLNAFLFIAICTVFIADLRTGREKDNIWTSVCVVDEHRISTCSNHSLYLQNFLQVMQQRGSDSRTTVVAQSNISFIKGRGKGRRHTQATQYALMENKRSYRLITNKNVLDIRENKVVIEETDWYFISIHLLLKRESRKNHTTSSETEVSVVRKGVTDQTFSPLMTTILPVLHGDQTLQTVQMADTFRLKNGDRIAVMAENPSLVYRCPNCNKITIMKTL